MDERKEEQTQKDASEGGKEDSAIVQSAGDNSWIKLECLKLSGGDIEAARGMYDFVRGS